MVLSFFLARLLFLGLLVSLARYQLAIYLACPGWRMESPAPRSLSPFRCGIPQPERLGAHRDAGGLLTSAATVAWEPG